MATVRISWRKIEETIKKDWRLIPVLVILQIVSAIPGYFLSGWTSVGVTLAFVLVTTPVGFLALTKVITISSSDGGV